MSDLLASIDVGTNTIRLLIGSVTAGGKLEPLLVRRFITRLGGGFCRRTGIAPDAAARSLAALQECSVLLADQPVSRLRAVATSAVRDAANGAAFVTTVKQQTGISLEIIDGHEEGILTLLGVLAGFDRRTETTLIFDIGGGSTEYTLARGSEVLFTRSLPLGVVRLTEGQGSMAAMQAKIDRELDSLQQQFAANGIAIDPHATTLIGTAGTATTLAAIDLQMRDYDYRRVNNHTLTRATIEGIWQRLLPLSPAERLRRLPGLEPGREDLIVAGTLLTLATLQRFAFPAMVVSDFGLLEGIAVQLADNRSR